MGAISDILSLLRIDSSRLYRDWDQNEKAIAAWIEEGSLRTVVLECTQPSGKVSPVIEFDIAYTSGGTEFRASQARLARFNDKVVSVPPSTTYRLICTFNGPRTPQPGWSPTTQSSTHGLSSLSFGTLGRAPDASASMRYRN